MKHIDDAAGVVAIKPSGVSYDDMRPEQMVILDLEGHVIDGELRASSDTPTHLELYRHFADIGGIVPWAGYAMYCASKAALINVTKTLAKELAPRVTVNAIAPGLVSWPQDGDKDEYNRQLKMIPLSRKGTGEEIAAAVIFLLQNDYITGQVLNVDGGRCI